MSEKLRNIDIILTTLQNKLTKISSSRKYDGITIECTLKSRSKYDTAKEEINTVCKELKLLPIQMEQNEENPKIFILQFPELNVEYTEEEITTMYISNFKWLLDDIMSKKAEVMPDKDLLIRSKDIYVRQAISIYCRCNINPYKDNINNYLNNLEYRTKIDNMYLEYLDKYCKEHNIK